MGVLGRRGRSSTASRKRYRKRGVCGLRGSPGCGARAKSKGGLNAPRGRILRSAPKTKRSMRDMNGRACRKHVRVSRKKRRTLTAVAKLDAVQPVADVLEREVDHQPTTGVAVDQASDAGSPLGAGARGEVYLDNGSSIAAFTPAGVLIQRFGSGQLLVAAGWRWTRGRVMCSRPRLGKAGSMCSCPKKPRARRWWMVSRAGALVELGAAFGADRPAGREQRIRVPVRHV